MRMQKPEHPDLWIGTEIVTREGKRACILWIGLLPQISYSEDFHTEPTPIAWKYIHPIDTPWTPFVFNGRSINDIEDWINCTNDLDTNPYDCYRCSLEYETPPEYVEHPAMQFSDTLRQFFIKNRMELI